MSHPVNLPPIPAPASPSRSAAPKPSGGQDEGQSFDDIYAEQAAVSDAAVRAGSSDERPPRRTSSEEPVGTGQRRPETPAQSHAGAGATASAAPAAENPSPESPSPPVSLPAPIPTAEAVTAPEGEEAADGTVLAQALLPEGAAAPAPAVFPTVAPAVAPASGGRGGATGTPPGQPDIAAAGSSLRARPDPLLPGAGPQASPLAMAEADETALPAGLTGEGGEAASARALTAEALDPLRVEQRVAASSKPVGGAASPVTGPALDPARVAEPGPAPRVALEAAQTAQAAQSAGTAKSRGQENAAHALAFALDAASARPDVAPPSTAGLGSAGVFVPLPAPAHATLLGVPAPAAAASPAADTAGTATVPIDGIALEIATRSLEGKRRFEIRLDPPELGRIDVRLDVSRDGQVTSRLMVERADTLDLLRRDSASLERALQSAGLQTGDSGLQFSLRDQSGQQADGQGDGRRPHVLIVPDEDVVVREAVQRGYSALRGFGRGIDIRV